jgi:hypothetical protein
MFEGPEPGSREYRELTHLLYSRRAKRRPFVPVVLTAVVLFIILI